MAYTDKALDGCVALVTGGSRGIGRAACLALAGRGAKVIINYRSREDAAREVAEQVEKAGGSAVVAGFDVANKPEVDEKIKALGKEHGLHILVNNAGIAINGLLMRFKDEDWHLSMDVNLAGTFYCSRAASTFLLKARDKGRIINLSSVVGEMGNAGQSAYAATKAGVLGLTKAMARELASRGVTVNAIAPGYIETDMTDAELPEDKKADLLAQIPLGRIGQPTDIGNIIAFLAGPEGGYITGQVLRVNGGMLM